MPQTLEMIDDVCSDIWILLYYSYSFYQSGVFDTVEYEHTYEKSQMNKDFRGFTFLQKSLWFVDHMRLLLRSMQSNRNASRLLNVSCRVVGLSCKSILYVDVAESQIAVFLHTLFTGGIKHTLHPFLRAYSTVFFVPPSFPSKQASKMSACVTR